MVLDAVIFDLDGVIINSEQLADKANVEFLESFGVTYDRNKIKPLLTGKTLLENTQVLMEYYQLKGDPIMLTKERIKSRQKLYENKLQFIPGFENFFQEIRMKSLKTAIATASPLELLEIANLQFSLSQLFDGQIYCVDVIGCPSKPAPDIFLYAAGALAVDPQCCLVIEDSPAGIESAIAAKMKVIGITTTYGNEKLAAATKIVDSFSEIDLTLYI